MKPANEADIAVIGGGIVGLAHAYMALRKGYTVVLFERDERALSASVRNFGLIWPVGQEAGDGLQRALRSRQHWLEVAEMSGLWLTQNGSIHLAYHDDELAVLDEFINTYKDDGYEVKLLSPNEVAMNSLAIKTDNLRGGMLSGTECTVNPRQALSRIPAWLQEKFGLVLKYGMLVTAIEIPRITAGSEVWSVHKVIVCSGADFQTLYPEAFAKSGLVKCKLQMMKATTGSGLTIGPSLCGGLTLTHYRSFRKCASLAEVEARYVQLDPRLKANGIHVLLAQNETGELIIGDSHHYHNLQPFDTEEVNQLILTHLAHFANLPDLRIIERWHGVYPRHPDAIDFVFEPEPGVIIVNGLGGAGMTLSFGLAEETINRL